MSDEMVSLVLVGLLFTAILAAAEAARALGAPAEWTRKLVHALSGFLSAVFPWLFTTAWSVAGLAAGYVVLMAVSRRGGWLLSVHGVQRRTLGGYCYPLAVVVTFAVARDRPEAYVPAILALAVGDATAALVGRSFGTTRYRVLGATRSLEGSVAMAVAVYPCVHLPLALMTPLGPLPCALWSLSVSVLTTLVEAAAPEGLDNFFVPVAAGACLLGVGRGEPPVAGLLLGLLFLLAAVATARGGVGGAAWRGSA